LFRFEGWKLAIPRWINCADALSNRRVSGHQPEERFADAIPKKHMTGLLGLRRLNVRAMAITADLLQSPGKSCRIARELHRRASARKFTLAAHGCLDEPSEKDPDPSNQKAPPGQQRDGRNREGPRSRPLLRLDLHEYPPNDSKAKNAENDPHQPQVQAHVTVQNVAELVPDHPLQFIPRQKVDRAAVTPMTASFVECPAAKRVNPASLSIKYTSGQGRRRRWPFPRPR